MRARRPLAPPLEEALLEAAGRLRGAIDPASCRHVIIGLLFLRSAEASFDDLPLEARWGSLTGRRAGLAARLDRALEALAARDPRLDGVLPHGYARLEIDEARLAALVELLTTIDPAPDGGALSTAAERLLGRFAAAEGRLGGDFYTPPELSRLMARLAGKTAGVVYDPCCGAGGLLGEASRLSGGRPRLVGQESNPSTRRLCAMVLSLGGLEADLGPRAADTLIDDLHPQLLADVVLANPPFNLRGYGPERLGGGGRFSLGPPPEKNANLAWLQHALARTAPGGRACVLLANGSSSSRGEAERKIRRALLERGDLEAMVALPARLFFATPIGVTLWVLARGSSHARPGAALFVDARGLGRAVSRSQRALTFEDVDRIVEARAAFASGEVGEAGFSRAVPHGQLVADGSSLDPARHVGAREAPAPAEPLSERIARLSAELEARLARGRELDQAVLRGLEALQREGR